MSYKYINCIFYAFKRQQADILHILWDIKNTFDMHQFKQTKCINYIPQKLTLHDHGNLYNHSRLHPCKWHNLDGTWCTCPVLDGGNGPCDSHSHTLVLEGFCVSLYTAGRGRGCCCQDRVHTPHMTCDRLRRKCIVNIYIYLMDISCNSWTYYVMSDHKKRKI